MAKVEILLPSLHPGQVAVSKESRRFNVVVAGRRWGKNELAKNKAFELLIRGKLVGCFSPTYKTLSEDWRSFKDVAQPITRDKSEQEHRLVLQTGGILEMWSLEEPDNALGRKYHRVLVDEAATVPNLEYAWDKVIGPQLKDYAGDAWFFSTPKGMNYFWRLYLRGQDQERWSNWASWRRPTSENPHILASEIEVSRQETPDAVFRQEFLAEFIEGTAGVFRNVKESATASPQELRTAGHTYVIGVDWGKRLDFSAFAVIDASTKEQVRLERMQQVDYSLQVGRLEALARRFQPDIIVVEENAMGIPLVEQLRALDLPIRPWQSTNAAKKELVERLALAFEREELKILNHPVQVDELQAFQATRTATGLERYAAPEGMHDDTVIALALAWGAAVAYPKIVATPDWRRDVDIGEPEDDLNRVGPGGYVWR